jgi:hypothetical protein
MNTSITIKEVSSKREIKEFIELPFKIYKNNHYWVPYFKKEEMKNLDKKYNPAYDSSDAAFWIAMKGNTCVGRIGAIVNHLYNQKVNEKVGRFSRAEFIDDSEVSSKLFEVAEKWLQDKGMTKVLGPLGFNNLDKQGVLVEGFQYIASVGSVYHHEYYHHHFEKLGYNKEIDWIEFRLKISEIPEKALRLNEVIKKRFGLHVIPVVSRQDIQKYAESIFDLINDSFDELPFVSPFTREMIEFYVKKYFGILNPKFIKLIANNENQIVAFIIGLPDISNAMQKTKGVLFPFGFLHVMNAMRNPKGLELLLTGINPKLQGQGVSALLITELQKEIIKHKITDVETTGIFETNNKVIEHWKNYEHIQHKRKRCYVKVF